MRNFKEYMGKITLTVVFLIAFFKIIDGAVEGGVYRHVVIGAVFEMTWLFLLLSLAALPVLWMVYMFRKEIGFKKGMVYIGLCALTIVGVLWF